MKVLKTDSNFVFSLSKQKVYNEKYNRCCVPTSLLVKHNQLMNVCEKCGRWQLPHECAETVVRLTKIREQRMIQVSELKQARCTQTHTKVLYAHTHMPHKVIHTHAHMYIQLKEYTHKTK